MATNEIKHEAGLAKAKQDAADERAQLERDYQKAKDDIAARDVKITGLEQEKSLAAEMVATVTTEKEDLQEKYVRTVVAWCDWVCFLCYGANMSLDGSSSLWFLCRSRWICQNEMVTKTEALKLEVEKVKQLSTEKQKLADDLEKLKKQMAEEKRQMVWMSRLLCIMAPSVLPVRDS